MNEISFKFDNNINTINIPYSNCDSFVLYKLFLKLNRLMLVITENALSAGKILEELQFFLPNKTIKYFGSKEIVPYDDVYPASSVTFTRLSILHELLTNKIDILLVSNNICELLPPVNYVKSNLLILKNNQYFSLADIKNSLLQSGYLMVENLQLNGEFSILGNIIDIFLIGHKNILRVEVVDDIIESIRIVDSSSGKTIEIVDHISIIPTKEYHTREFSEELKSDSNEFYWPLFFDEKAVSLLSYLPDSVYIVYYSSLLVELEQYTSDVNHAFNKYKERYYCLPPTTLYLSPNCVIDLIADYQTTMLIRKENSLNKISSLSFTTISNHLIHKAVQEFTNNFTGKVYIVANDLGKLTLIKNNMFCATAIYITAPLYGGFICNDSAVITEKELLKESRERTLLVSNYESLYFQDLQLDELVVHSEYGIGKYKGIFTKNIVGVAYDMVALEFKNNVQIFVPTNDLSLLHKYHATGDEYITDLHSWNKVKNKVKKKVADIAAELLQIYAKRAQQNGFSFNLPNDYTNFVAEFEHTPTKDQEHCFEDILSDMLSNKHMDRLICADVGFGKTEIAMRAAFICVSNNKQVVFLAPTTLLVEQHYQSFVDRFKNFAVIIDFVSRFKTTKNIKLTLNKFLNGELDILIGTHRLLQKDVQCNNLGLLIIDEEHRFGVKQKERFKQLAFNSAIISMTATPIPRTLSMSLDGIRDFSVITTPPQKRLPINTSVHLLESKVIVEAVMRELHRGGQIFFVYNDVSTIESMANKLKSQIPQVNLVVVHGQLETAILEQRIRAFIAREYNLLLCSSIIENGIDIPNANTIFIYNAQNFGLAQLHQLRGRVGRSHHQAYCYLLVKELQNARIDSIYYNSNLGAGMQIAMNDLEIRGAGEVLGAKQSGYIKDIGIGTYFQLLKDAMNNITKNTVAHKCTVNIYETAIIPVDYCKDPSIRVFYYQQIANATTHNRLDDIYIEMVNLFGIPTLALNLLFQKAHITLTASTLCIETINITKYNFEITFLKEITDTVHQGIIQLMIENCTKQIDRKLVIENDINDIKKKLLLLGEILACL